VDYIEFEEITGDSKKKILNLTKYQDHLELQIIDNAYTNEESIKFFILFPEHIEKLKEYLDEQNIKRRNQKLDY
jgi:hypothetical protein